MALVFALYRGGNRYDIHIERFAAFGLGFTQARSPVGQPNPGPSSGFQPRIGITR